MRTFNVTMKHGPMAVIRCHHVHSPDAVTPCWRFLGFAGTVLWSFHVDEVVHCIERQRVEVSPAPSPLSGRSCGIQV